MLVDQTPDIGGWLDAAVEARWWLVAAGGLGAAAWSAGAVWWRRRAARVLRSRHVVQVLPSQTFDPSRDEVLSAAPRLHRLPQVAGLLPRRARAVRIRMTSSAGLLEYHLHAPRDAAHVLDMPLYQGVEVRPDGADGYAQVPRIRFATAGPSMERAR